MRVACLGSGSKGNASVIESGDSTVLLDCGFSLTETRRRMARLGLDADRLDAILVTHEHSDHAKGVAMLARRFHIPVFATAGTLKGMRDNDLPDARLICSHTAFRVGGLQVVPMPVPHDAREPCQFVFSDGERRLGILSDTGHVTAHIRERLDACDALLIECNHDSGMLADGPYPPALKRRVGGQFGHLNNDQAAALLAGLDQSRLGQVFAIHLSEINNTPELALSALMPSLGNARTGLAVIDQGQGLEWFDLGEPLQAAANDIR